MSSVHRFLAVWILKVVHLNYANYLTRPNMQRHWRSQPTQQRSRCHATIAWPLHWPAQMHKLTNRPSVASRKGVIPRPAVAAGSSRQYKTASHMGRPKKASSDHPLP